MNRSTRQFYMGRNMIHSTVSIVFISFIFLQMLHVTPHSIVRSKRSLSAIFSRAAVASNAPPCAEIGKNVLSKGGKAVDAAIATMICEGVVNPQNSGIGGGFTMVIYNRSLQRAETIIARERAPAKAEEESKRTRNGFTKGALSIGVPGEIRGYWKAYNNFGGGVTWKQLFEPSIKLCNNGITVGLSLANAILRRKESLKKNSDFNFTFTNLYSGMELKTGDIYQNKKLAETLSKIANEGADVFYEGSMAESIVTSIHAQNGIITKEDLKNYQPRLEDSFEATIFENFTIHTIQPPSSGPILTYILKLVDGLLPVNDELLYAQRVVEALKFAYGARTKLGDPYFVNINKVLELITSEEKIQITRKRINDNYTSNNVTYYGGEFTQFHDNGTANVAVISENGDAVVATTTINDRFGSEIMSSSTGIIFNNQLADFSYSGVTNIYDIEPSKANYIAANKMPMSSTAPSIITDKNGDVRLVIGGAGGPKITSAVAQIIIRYLLYNEYIETAVHKIYFHHQLLPMVCEFYRIGNSKETSEGMKSKGHTVEAVSRFSIPAITGIERRDNQLHAVSNYKTGQVAGY